MFKNIKYLGYNNIVEAHVYKLTDTEFECEIFEKFRNVSAVWRVSSASLEMLATISGYEKQNYERKYLVKNLFLCMLYTCKKYEINFEYLLHYFYKHYSVYLKDITINDFKFIQSKYGAFL